MKRIICCLLIIFGLFAFASCTDEKPKTNEESESNNTVETKQPERIDVDLTILSGTVAYSQVYDMLCNPSKYIGKTVKMEGLFSVYYGEDTGLYYPAVIIKDATACCAQGIEFVLKNEPPYPSGYPKEGTVVTVKGRFGVYYEGSDQYCHLVDAEIL